jgi:hypothetical protein
MAIFLCVFLIVAKFSATKSFDEAQPDRIKATKAMANKPLFIFEVFILYLVLYS